MHLNRPPSHTGSGGKVACSEPSWQIPLEILHIAEAAFSGFAAKTGFRKISSNSSILPTSPKAVKKQ
jgi:hypothetical protein